MLIASQFGKTLVFCFRVAPELHGEAIFAISGDQTPRLGHIDVVVSDIYIYIYIYRYPLFFWRSFAYMFDMGNSSTANRRSYFKMSNLLKQQWVRASFAARMRGIKQPIPPVPQAIRLEFGRFLVVVLNSLHWFPWLPGNTIRFWMFLDFVASWERGRSQSTNWNRKLQQGIKWRIKAKACTSTAVCDLVMFSTWFVKFHPVSTCWLRTCGAWVDEPCHSRALFVSFEVMQWKLPAVPCAKAGGTFDDLCHWSSDSSAPESALI